MKGRINKRGQLNGAMMKGALAFVMFLVLGIILSTSGDVNQSFVDRNTNGPVGTEGCGSANVTCTAAFNVSADVGTGLNEVGEQMPNVGNVLIALLIISLLFGLFAAVSVLRT